MPKNDQQVQIWNVVCTVWTEHAHNPIFARDFVKIYCDNSFTLQYLIQGLSKTNDVAAIVWLCNACEQLKQQNPNWSNNQSRILADFSVPSYTENHADFDPIQRLKDLKQASLLLDNIRLYCYAVVLLRPEHWDECVAYSQEKERDFLFEALKVSSKDFTYWGVSPCSEQHLTKWNNLCSTLNFYPGVRHQLKQRIEESEFHYQNKRIQSALSVSAPSISRKI